MTQLVLCFLCRSRVGVGGGGRATSWRKKKLIVGGIKHKAYFEVLLSNFILPLSVSFSLDIAA